MSQLGANALGEVLEPGRVPDCYLGLLLDPTDHDTQAAGLLVVAPAALLHPHVPQLDGTVLYELVTRHPDRAAHELVFLPDLAVELRAWPSGTWARLGFDLQAAARGDHRRLAGRPPQGPPARAAQPTNGSLTTAECRRTAVLWNICSITRASWLRGAPRMNGSG